MKAIEAAKPRLAITAQPHGTTPGSAPSDPSGNLPTTPSTGETSGLVNLNGVPDVVVSALDLSNIGELHAEWMSTNELRSQTSYEGGGDRDTPPIEGGDPSQINWPHPAGALGPIATVTLPKGTTFDRYGSDGGDYVSPVGVPYEQRALPPANAQSNYTTFTLNEDLPGVKVSVIAPWFGAEGMGVQYQLPARAFELLQKDADGNSIITATNRDE
ncbi:TNT domain-containing protein [Glycomyces luteolus]|uniref:TNT domain-containing protein n=1 Tax=Glycomyces luteolus TaxID=2670330 RepID=A0A9X3SNV4_9ACTN|nr:TNT domain-containing protein [Glycomyces luteolus]MDA1358662.1 TNT domain-containing protein [Glycomyces luteolus]